MGKAGKALRQVLESYNITQNQLAGVMGVKRFAVFRWFHEKTDPTAETVDEIAKALQQINPSAASEFVRLYLGEYLED
ncbi:MAG TPA: helix-turn-helix transcriptional regulator [Oscillatoriales cyanobacterium M4454_W2019_049]|nr:helix-turn-helix transcriptional regulator [Oscillatoriales cyanobacterium M4454_W2019_049]